MYCPNCAAPIDGVKFCRSCGANVSLVPEAMTGRLTTTGPDTAGQDDDPRERHRRRGHSSIAGGIQRAFMGLGFVFVALALSFTRSGDDWWFWMLIPAFIFLGSGIGEIVRAKQAQEITPYVAPPSPRHAAPHVAEMPAPNTAQIAPPPSIIEDTTRRFDPAKRSGEKR